MAGEDPGRGRGEAGEMAVEDLGDHRENSGIVWENPGIVRGENGRTRGEAGDGRDYVDMVPPQSEGIWATSAAPVTVLLPQLVKALL